MAVTARPRPSEPGAGAPPCWIAAPDRSGPSRIVRQQYGPAPGPPQACKGPADGRGSPDSRSGRSGARLINPDRFDKNLCPYRLESVDQEPSHLTRLRRFPGIPRSSTVRFTKPSMAGAKSGKTTDLEARHVSLAARQPDWSSQRPRKAISPWSSRSRWSRC